MTRKNIRYYIHLFIITLTFLFCNLQQTQAAMNDGNRYAANSVLAESDWYKIQIAETGVYKLTYEDLKKMGLQNPQNVQIYGYGGWILDENFVKPYVDDLPQISIWMSKEPANFGAGDYILFYGRGDVKWEYSNSLQKFIQTQNPYSLESFYFVTEKATGQKRVETIPSDEETTATISTSTFNDYALHEKELINLGETGRQFFGESFNVTTSQSFPFTLTGNIADSITIIDYNFAYATGSSAAAKLELSANGTIINTAALSSSNLGDYIVAFEKSGSFSEKNIGENPSFKLAVTKGSSADKNLYLDYIRINYTRKLKPYGASTLFRSKKNSPSLKFEVANANSNTLIFDVTDNTTIKQIKGNLSGTNLSFVASNTVMREYALVDLNQSFSKPTVIGKINNQNLHAAETHDMVIIVQPYLQKYAEQLAQIHADDSGLTSLIVNPQDIYNEFSSGKPDVMAYRRFLKMFYDRKQSGMIDESPKYLLLFGDGSYDNRFITNEWNKAEKRGILLTYQSVISLTNNGSICTDDNIGQLNDEETTNNKLQIGIGRIPVRTTSEAAIAVNKIEKYIKNENPGIWQNSITLISDDLLGGKSSTISSERNHINGSEIIANNIKKNFPEVITQKVYEDAYERVITSNGPRYPEAQKAMFDYIDKGTLVLNYIGHGSPRDWAHEYIIVQQDIENMTNTCLPLWITQTCDFGRFDANDLNYASSAETALLNPKGGAIALFATTRVIGISGSKLLNNNFFTEMFTPNKDGSMPRLGDIIMKAKNQTINSDNKVFILLGDPALRLNYPKQEFKVKVTEINDKPIGSSNYQMKALSYNKIKGQIVDAGGNPVTDYNGTLRSIVYDSEQELKTRGNQRNGTDPSIATNYTDFTNTIFTGNAQIVDGEFEFAFVTPKDILYTDGQGKMNFYAYSDEMGDANGYFSQYVVGGTDGSAVEENNPPVIEALYLNKESFKSGDVVNATPVFYAQVSDDTGINQSSAIGHNISVMIDGKDSYDLTSYFQLNDSLPTVGSVRYQLPEMSNGKHSLMFKVWDVWNNSQTQNVEFEVSDNYKPNIYDFKIWGNPARTSTKFVFTSDVPGSTLKVKYQVFTMTGAMVWQHEESGTSSTMSNYVYEWDLRGGNGARIEAGVYICRVTISIDGKGESAKSEKLIVLGQ
ncbi:hypothetical protein M2132_000350 [Dysgonomonas sp. PH5-45]|uniref:type IX secretion system sortase PorU n=1 Tax=unclassified Dysgonomonas TaxID=2630389 RepID=UPI002473754A|nr:MULTISPECIES: type IX secretion system sortase PorU [unclassified Dysgonomonas]MDH6354030.1 hypothetical protein [Dysgonomonas sp. PH5-45]MDH6386932.1 hypothetical protein [Dysgonomonas sp. PH5-37]